MAVVDSKRELHGAATVPASGSPKNVFISGEVLSSNWRAQAMEEVKPKKNEFFTVNTPGCLTVAAEPR